MSDCSTTVPGVGGVASTLMIREKARVCSPAMFHASTSSWYAMARGLVPFGTGYFSYTKANWSVGCFVALVIRSAFSVDAPV